MVNFQQPDRDQTQGTDAHMGKQVPEFITFWGPSINDWGNGPDTRLVVQRDEDLLKNSAEGGRRMEVISVDEILQDDVVTGVDMVNGYLPLACYGNEDLIIEVTNCDQEQGGWHRNIGADEWVFQYRGSRTINCETGPVTLTEGDMSVIPRGVAHQNVGHGTNIELTIYTRKPLKRLAPTDPAAARERMRIKDGKPVMPPVTLADAED